jgi:hypothetical protein
MKYFNLPIKMSLLLFALAGCSLQPPSGTLHNPTAVPPSIPPSGYEPQPGDANLERDQVLLGMENSRLVIGQSFPAPVSAILNGDLSDPCHQLRVMVTFANAQNQINLEVYSVFDPSVACITVLKPFTVSIPLGSYTNSQYTVMVNGERLGLFDIGSGIAPAVPVTP